MDVDWELCESGPADTDRTVLFLPGGLCRARSYEELMAEPALAEVRLVAATLPGHGGTPPPDDFSIENYARLADDERRTLEACPNTSVITVADTSFFLPNEESERIAELVVEALGRH
jgi:pimeloyl-ACP methyl ester carboxylesterase